MSRHYTYLVLNYICETATSYIAYFVIFFYRQQSLR